MADYAEMHTPAERDECVRATWEEIRRLQAKAEDIPMQADDILFVPTSARKFLESRTAEAAVQMATSAALITIR